MTTVSSPRIKKIVLHTQRERVLTQLLADILVLRIAYLKLTALPSLEAELELT